MFSNDQKKLLTEAGHMGLPLEDCGAYVGMTARSFLKLYEIDDSAQMSYEAGRTQRKIEILDTIKNKSDESSKTYEHKALELAANLFDLKPTPSSRKANQVTTTKESELDEQMTNPLLFMGGADLEEMDKKKK